MSTGVLHDHTILHFLSLLLLLSIINSHCSSLSSREQGQMAPEISPYAEPKPLLPLLAPSPLLGEVTMENLSGLCSLNFTLAKDVISTTATDCWTSFAPYLGNAVCCPQLNAMLVTLIGQSSKYSGVLALNKTHASHCLADIKKILVSQGASENLLHLCSVQTENLTEASCPHILVDKIESIIDSSRLLTACKRIDPVTECCNQVCQNAVVDSARKIALSHVSKMDEDYKLFEKATKINGCKNIVLRLLASKLDPATTVSILRGLSSCKLNRVCPLVFPNVTQVGRACANDTDNRTACCGAMNKYMNYLQQQSFITNLQAMNCAASLGFKLLNANVSNNVYNLCRTALKDFSFQVGSQGSGCLLPSLPSDATFDKNTGIGFICDLNDNIAAPWPTASSLPPSSCDINTKLPALPTATSSQNGNMENLSSSLLVACLFVVQTMRRSY